MSEKHVGQFMSYVQVDEILNQIECFDQHNQFAKIIDFIQNLDDKYHTVQVKSELARAYNNMYWENKTPENLSYLQKSIDILLSLETEVEDDDVSNWHYRIGYAYYFMENMDKAVEHLIQVDNINHSLDLLRQIEWVKRHQISAVEASLNHSRYLMQDFLSYCQNYFPELFKSFNRGVENQQLDDFAQQIQCKIPSPYRQYFMMMNGQKQQSILADYIEDDMLYFVPLDEIVHEQQQWKNKLTRILGANWQTIEQENDELFSCREWVKPMLFNEKWLPFVVGEHQILCIDLDPIFAEDYGQVLCIELDEQLLQCSVYYYASALQDVIALLLEQLKALHMQSSEISSIDDSPILFS